METISKYRALTKYTEFYAIIMEKTIFLEETAYRILLKGEASQTE